MYLVCVIIILCCVLRKFVYIKFCVDAARNMEHEGFGKIEYLFVLRSLHQISNDQVVSFSELMMFKGAING